METGKSTIYFNFKTLFQARGRKNVHVELPDFRADQEVGRMKPADVRVMFLRRGFNIGKDVGAREWKEKQYTMQSFCKGILFATFLNFSFRRRFG